MEITVLSAFTTIAASAVELEPIKMPFWARASKSRIGLDKGSISAGEISRTDNSTGALVTRTSRNIGDIQVKSQISPVSIIGLVRRISEINDNYLNVRYVEFITLREL
jgi:hypothetical protein